MLSELQLGDDKASHLLRKMHELASSSLTDDLKNVVFTAASCRNARHPFVSSESLNNLAKMADKIAEVWTDSVSGAKYSINERSRGEQSSDLPLNEMATLRAQIDSFSQQVERLPRAHSRD